MRDKYAHATVFEPKQFQQCSRLSVIHNQRSYSVVLCNILQNLSYKRK